MPPSGRLVPARAWTCSRPIARDVNRQRRIADAFQRLRAAVDLRGVRHRVARRRIAVHDVDVDDAIRKGRADREPGLHRVLRGEPRLDEPEVRVVVQLALRIVDELDRVDRQERRRPHERQPPGHQLAGCGRADPQARLLHVAWPASAHRPARPRSGARASWHRTRAVEAVGRMAARGVTVDAARLVLGHDAPIRIDALPAPVVADLAHHRPLQESAAARIGESYSSFTMIESPEGGAARSL